MQHTRTTFPILAAHRVILQDVPPAETLVNAERQKVQARALRVEQLLVQAAQGHALDMAVRNYVAHKSPDGDGVGTRIDRAGYKQWVFAGENIAAGFSTPEAVFLAWLNLPGHRRNFLDTNFREIGVAVVYDEADEHNVLIMGKDVGGPYWWYWVADLANRRKRGAFMPLVAKQGN